MPPLVCRGVHEAGSGGRVMKMAVCWAELGSDGLWWWRGARGLLPMLAVILMVVSPGATATDPGTPLNGLRDQLDSTGTLRVIVELRIEPAVAHRPLKSPARLSAVNNAQQKIQQMSQTEGAVVLGQSTYMPLVTMEVDREGLEQLAARDDVVSIQEDKLLSPVLASSIPVIGADHLHGAGITGAGQAIAVIDTGVDGSHPFIEGKIAAEACFSSNYPTQHASSLCNGNMSEVIDVGAGQPCTISNCDHGTHVAGIAAGNGEQFKGVAPDASLVAVQVFSRFDSSTVCGALVSTPCALAYTSDVIRGLEYVYSVRDTLDIAAINISLGGGLYDTAIDCDSAQPSMKLVIDLLRGAGIATVVASGNSGQSGRLQSPSCLSSVISVGASTDDDQQSAFSNAASWLSLLAPGSSIRSSVPGGGYQTWNGTSMATPHVAGALALIRSQSPTATVSQMLAALSNTGQPLVLPGSGFIKPRIRLIEALSWFAPGRRPPFNLILDNDYGSTQESGEFNLIVDRSAYFGRYLESVGSNNSYRFIPELPVSGSYRVYAWWAKAATAARAVIDVQHSSGTSRLEFNQSLDGGRWIEVGVFPFDSGNTGFVELSDLFSEGIAVDAVKFELLDSGNLSIENSDLPKALIAQSYQAPLVGSGGTLPYQWQLEGALPPGLIFDAANAVIQGTPRLEAEGEWPLTLILQDAEDNQATRELVLVVDKDPPPEIIIDDGDPQTWQQGDWFVSSGVGPWAGQSLYSNSDARFRWLPSVIESGSYQVFAWWTYYQNRSTTVPYKIRHREGQSTVIVNQADPDLGSRWVLLGSFNFDVGDNIFIEVSSDNGQASADAVRLVALNTSPAPLALVTEQLPNAVQQSYYQVQLAAQGGREPYQWSVSGDLPEGVVLNPETGELSGIVTETLLGSYPLTVEVSDANVASASRSLSIEVLEQPPLPTELIIDNLDSNTRQVGEWFLSSGLSPWSLDSIYSNFDSSFEWLLPELVAGSYEIYAWWTHHPNRSETVRYQIRDYNGTHEVIRDQLDPALAGQWNLLGSYSFDDSGDAFVEVSSLLGQASADAVRLVAIDKALSIETSVLDDGVIGHEYLQPLSARGGVPPYQWSVTGTMPPGLTLDANTGLFSGQLGPESAGLWMLMLRVTDQRGDTVQNAVSINVLEAAPIDELIIDNQDAATSQSGSWFSSGGINPWNGHSLYSNRDAIFRWYPNLPLGGTYKVYAWWTYYINRSDTVPYRINHSGGVTRVLVNQRDSRAGGRWNLLGTFDIPAGSEAYIEVSTGKRPGQR